jgi:DNA-binding protein HU-beta
MTKADLIGKISEKTGTTHKLSEDFLTATIDSIKEALSEHEKVALFGFGTFEVKHKEERTGRNPATKEVMTIPASYAPSFKSSRALKDAVNHD